MKRKLLSLLLGIAIAVSFVTVPVDAASNHTYYSQKGWIYNNVKLNSMCFCASIAMSLSDLGVKVTPLDIYINNGETAYCKGNEITAKDFGVNWKLVYLEKNGAWPAEKKQTKIIELLSSGNYPQGLLLYGGGHMVVARKVVGGTVYVDDPIYGCCVPINKCDKVRFNNITVISYFYGGAGSKAPVSAPSGKTSKPAVSVNGQSVTVSWDYSGGASQFDVYLVQAPWGWGDIRCSFSTTSKTCTFTNVTPGDYCAFTIARPNADSVQSEWASFIVAPPQTNAGSSDSTPGGNVSAGGPYYTIKNMGSEKMLNVVSNSSKSGTNVTVYQEDGTTGQNFEFIPNGRGGYVLEPQCAPDCALNVYGQSSAAGANVTIWTKSGHSTQDWNIESVNTMSRYVIRSADNPNYVLAAAGTGNASNVQLQQYDPNNLFQIWTSPVFASISTPSGNPEPPSVQTPETSAEEDFSPRTDSYYTVRNMGSEKMLNVVSNSSKSGANITIYQEDGTTGQNFMFIPDGTGGYVLQPQCAPDCAVNIYGQFAAEGYNVTTWTKSGHSTQSWKIEREHTWGGCVIRSMNDPDYVVTATGSGNASNVQIQRYDPSNSFQVWTSGAF